MPPVVFEGDERRESGVAREDVVDAGKVLERRVDEAKKREMLRKKKSTGVGG